MFSFRILAILSPNPPIRPMAIPILPTHKKSV